MLIVAPSASVSKRTSGRFWRSSHSRSLPVPFTFVARAENLIRGRPDLDDTIKRLQAFEKAGADVLYAPGLRDLETMRTVVEAIGKPLNVVMSAADPALRRLTLIVQVLHHVGRFEMLMVLAR